MAKKTPRGGAREGAGRPRRYSGDLVRFGVSMPANLVTLLDELAAVKAAKVGRKVSRSEVLVDLLEKTAAMRDAVRDERV